MLILSFEIPYCSIVKFNLCLTNVILQLGILYERRTHERHDDKGFAAYTDESEGTGETAWNDDQRICELACRSGQETINERKVMIKILEELEGLIPPLSVEELMLLEESILSEGCRDPLVLWGDILIDGHNRYSICQLHDIPFTTVQRDFDSIEEVKVWMIRNQFGKRNITPFVRAELALMLEPMLKDKAKENMVKSTKNNVVNIDKVNTREEIAKEANISTGNIAKVKKILEKAPEVVKELVRSGDISINAAHKEIVKEEKKAERKADIEQQKIDIEEGVAVLPEGKFEVIAIDPPWNYGREYDPDSSRVANPYPEMEQSELLDLDIPAADDSVIFLWTTHAFIFDAKELLDKWGFTYKASMVWDKEKIGMGHWVRMQCEFCLIGIKGKPIWDNTTWRDIIREPRREHSRKPEAFYKMVEDVTVGRRLEYFSRTERKGWEIFGNDIGRLS